jgi:3-carboxy-cis,cis-muconate cycloisomerase
VERDPAGAQRNGVLRLLSLELTFCDERCAAALTDEHYLAAMVRFEAALAAASARAGIIPANAAQAITAACKRASFNSAALAREARVAGTLAIPFVKILTAKLAGDAVRYVHFGATSQDVLDTATALCLKEASGRISELVVLLGDAAASLAKRHAATPMLARTLLQPAAPVPFGWKAAMWLAPFARAYPRFRQAVANGCVLQLGGATGTLSAFANKGLDIARMMAAELGLESALTWHSARDGFARLGAEFAILSGLAAKIARDVSLLMQAEVNEASEPAAAGRGGSSSMPHKRNPAASLLALEAAARAPGLAATLLAELAPEHERGLGQWQSQWLTLRSLACACASALAAVAELLQGLEVNEQAMHANIERTHGLAYSEALSLRLSRPLTERLCEQALRERRSLLEVTLLDSEAAKVLSPKEIETLFDPRGFFGAAPAMIERVLADWANARESAA